MTHIIGTCGNCGGPVEVPKAWLGIDPPVPTCRSCGATLARLYGPVLPMMPRPKGYDLGPPYGRQRAT